MASFFSKLFKAVGSIAPVIGGFGGFTGGSSLLPLIATGLSAVGSLAEAFGGNEKVKSSPAATTAALPPLNLPQGPPPDPTSFKRPTSLQNVPQFLAGSGLSPQLSNLQQRALIATQGTQGDSAFRSDEAKNYYRNLTNYDLVGPSGSLAGFENILPSEMDYIKRVLGQDIRTQDTRGFLAALNRGVV